MSVVVTGDRALPGEVAGGTGRQRVGERRSRALAALAAAEMRTGVRRTRTVASGPAEPPGGGDARRLTVHPALAGLLPNGMLPAGGTLAVLGSMSLLLGLLATPSQEGAWVVFAGAPAVGLVAAADAGLVLDRVAVVPAPGPAAPAVVAALLDGIDVVVLGPDTALTDADRRRLAARARERGAVLATMTPWPGAHVTLDVRSGSWWGVDAGAGWLRRRALSVRRTGRGAAAHPADLQVEVPLVAGAPGRPEDGPERANIPRPTDLAQRRRVA